MPWCPSVLPLGVELLLLTVGSWGVPAPCPGAGGGGQPLLVAVGSAQRRALVQHGSYRALAVLRPTALGANNARLARAG